MNKSEFFEAMKAKGYRVFVANPSSRFNRFYGFFTKDGANIVSFQEDFGSMSVSGNYTTENPKQTGTGWQIASVSLQSIVDNAETFLNASAPRWAHHGFKWRYTTLDEHLVMYGRSSKYQEV